MNNAAKIMNRLKAEANNNIGTGFFGSAYRDTDAGDIRCRAERTQNQGREYFKATWTLDGKRISAAKLEAALNA